MRRLAITSPSASTRLARADPPSPNASFSPLTALAGSSPATRSSRSSFFLEQRLGEERVVLSGLVFIKGPNQIHVTADVRGREAGTEAAALAGVVEVAHADGHAGGLRDPIEARLPMRSQRARSFRSEREIERRPRLEGA